MPDLIAEALAGDAAERARITAAADSGIDPPQPEEISR